MSQTKADCPQCGAEESLTLDGNLDGYAVVGQVCDCALTAEQVQKVEWDVLEAQRDAFLEAQAESGYEWWNE